MVRVVVVGVDCLVFLGFSCIVVDRVNSVGVECVLYAVLRVCFGFACTLFICCDFV